MTTIVAAALALVLAAGCGRPEATAETPASTAAATTFAATPAARPQAPATTATALPATPTAAASAAGASAIALATQAQTTAATETAMPDKPTSPPDPTRPQLNLSTTAVPKRTAVAEQAPAPGGAVIAPPFDPGLAALVDGAKADLARRRSVAIGDVDVVEVRSVTWPDPGLGCPQPGMAYKQVPVDGLLIRLGIGGQVFNYHGGGGKAPFLCEQPARDAVPPVIER